MLEWGLSDYPTKELFPSIAVIYPICQDDSQPAALSWEVTGFLLRLVFESSVCELRLVE